MSEFNYDLLIIGAGPGGYEAAFYAAELGMKVAIAEKDRLGGTCLNRGCIPTKALMHSSDVYRDAAHGAEVGVECDGLRANRARIGERKDEVLDTLRNGIAGLIKKKKIDLIEGEAKVVAPHRVVINGEEYTAENIMVATGSKPFMPPIPGYDLPGVVDKRSLSSSSSAAESSESSSLRSMQTSAITLQSSRAWTDFFLSSTRKSAAASR